MKARLAKKALRAASLLHLDRGDTLVVRIRAADDPDGVSAVLRHAFPRNQIMLLLPGQSVSVLRAQEPKL
jgi:hypothetical protein